MVVLLPFNISIAQVQKENRCQMRPVQDLLQNVELVCGKKEKKNYFFFLRDSKSPASLLSTKERLVGLFVNKLGKKNPPHLWGIQPSPWEKIDSLSYNWVTWQLVISGRNFQYICIQTSCVMYAVQRTTFLWKIFWFWFCDGPSTIWCLRIASRVPCKSAHSQVPWLEL